MWKRHTICPRNNKKKRKKNLLNPIICVIPGVHGCAIVTLSLVWFVLMVKLMRVFFVVACRVWFMCMCVLAHDYQQDERELIHLSLHLFQCEFYDTWRSRISMSPCHHLSSYTKLHLNVWRIETKHSFTSHQ